MVPIQQHLDALVHHPQQLADVQPGHLNIVKQLGLRRHLAEYKAPAQGNIQPGQGAVGGVHSADQIEVTGHTEGLFGVRQHNGQCFVRPCALGRLNQRNQLAKNSRNIAPVDFIDDQHPCVVADVSWWRSHQLLNHRREQALIAIDDVFLYLGLGNLLENPTLADVIHANLARICIGEQAGLPPQR